MSNSGDCRRDKKRALQSCRWESTHEHCKRESDNPTAETADDSLSLNDFELCWSKIKTIFWLVSPDFHIFLPLISEPCYNRFSRYTAVWKSRAFKTTKMFRYTVFAVCCFFLRVITKAERLIMFSTLRCSIQMTF